LGRGSVADESIYEMAKKFATEEKVDREDLRYFLDKVVDSYNRLRKAAGKSIATAAALAGLFVLMSAGGLTEAELFGVKVSRFALFLVIIPAAIAFMFLRYCALTKSSVIYQIVFYEITERHYPSWYESSLGSLLLTGNTNFGNALHETYFEKGIGWRTVWLTSTLELLFALLGPAAFDVYAYIFLFGAPEIDTVGVTVSAIVSGLLIVLGWLHFLIGPFGNEQKG